MPFLPYLQTLQDLSDLTHLSVRLLQGLTHRTNKFYRHYDIRKASGGLRHIAAPSPKLKAVQAWILRYILDGMPVSEAASGFISGKNTRDHAWRHRGCKYLLCLDVERFFDSIPYPRVYSVFRRKYGRHVSHLLTDLCTLEGWLPQGAVTSPALSNLVCFRMDNRILGYASRRDIIYSRYADDLSFSTDLPGRLAGVPHFVAQVLAEDGMRLNKAKTRFMGTARRHRLTGLVLGSSSVGLGVQTKRRLRASVHRFALVARTGTVDADSSLKLRGWIAYARSVDPECYPAIRDQIKKLDRRLGTRIASRLLPSARPAVAAQQPAP